VHIWQETWGVGLGAEQSCGAIRVRGCDHSSKHVGPPDPTALNWVRYKASWAKGIQQE
jgi:hypothetical protein